MKVILLLFLLTTSYIFSDELSERKLITNSTTSLFNNNKFNELSKISKSFLEDEERTSNGKWKLNLFYWGIKESVNTKRTDKIYWKNLEDKTLKWVNLYQSSPSAYISHAIILIEKAWMYRGTNYSRNTKKEQFDKFHENVNKAKEYLEKYKTIASLDPNWYAIMVEIANYESWSTNEFNKLMDEAITRHPSYYLIYYNALYYMSPKWGNFNKEEVEALAQKALKATKNKNSIYARFYWAAAEIIYKDDLFLSSDVNWSLMSKGIDEVLDEYPSQYSLNHFAYYACLAKDKEKTKELISKIKQEPLRKAWKSKAVFNTCKEWSNTIKIKTEKKYVKNVLVNNLETYIKKYSYDKPLYIHFSSYIENCEVCEIKILEEIAKEYDSKMNFVSVNFSDKYNVRKYINLYSKYYLKKIPSSIIVYKEKILLRKDNNLLEAYMDSNLKYSLDSILLELKDKTKEKDFLKMFKKYIMDNASYCNTEANIRSNTEEYMSSKAPFKALAVAASMQNDTWVSGRSLSLSSQTKANQEALIDCEKDRNKMNKNVVRLEEKCKLYMIGDTYVYEKTMNYIK